ncbi:MAG: flagellar export chaperone FliS [Treponema sp.]|jgi:flagellar protein FliS|nr:flagellar export chaperone FliS [Treponema sp.]
MPYKNASNTYKETRIKTAGQGQLIVMLYDEAVKQLTKACELLEMNKTNKRDPGRIEQISKAVMKTEEIITELMVSLDFEQGGDIAKNLFSLYTWFNRELLEANISQNVHRMLTVRDMLAELRNTWNTISNQSPVEQSKRETAGLNIAG